MSDAMARLWGTRRRRLLVITACALLLRVAFLLFVTGLDPEAVLSRDSDDYLRPALNLITEGTFSRSGAPEVLRTPGYSAFLVPLLTLLGDSAVLGVVLVHFLLEIGVAGATYRLVELTPAVSRFPQAPLVAYALVLFEPNLFIWEFNVGTETLFTALIAAAILSLAKGMKEEKAGWVLLGIMIITPAAFVRPIGLFLPYLIGLLFGTYYLLRRKWMVVAALAAGVFVHQMAIGAWEARNERIFGVRTFSAMSGYHMYTIMGAGVLARAEGRKLQNVRAEHREHMEAWEADTNQAQSAARAERRGKEILIEHPYETGMILFQGLTINLLDPGTELLAHSFGLRESGSGIKDKFNNSSPGEFIVYLVTEERAFVLFAGLGFIWILVMWGSAGYAVLKGVAGRDVVTLLAALVAAYLIALAAGPQSYARFRAPATPLILVYSAIGLSAALARWRAGRRGSDPSLPSS